MKQRFPASDEYVVWAQSLSGMLTKIKTTYGSVSEMVEHPDWDESKTQFFLLLGNLGFKLAHYQPGICKRASTVPSSSTGAAAVFASRLVRS